jgi:hypothetical protein
MRIVRVGILTLAAALVGNAPARPADDIDAMVPEEGAAQVMLLRQKSVREELKLSESESDKIYDFNVRQWKKARSYDNLTPAERDRKFEELTGENEQFLKETLAPEQRKRLDQITLQVAGLLWVTSPKVASELGLTAEQKERARALQEEARREMRDVVHAKSREGRDVKFEELRKTSRQRLMELLTDQQELRWKQMTGEPFRGRLRFHAEREGEG